MKSNKELREDFFKLIDEFNAVSIAELAEKHQRQIPYIEMLVLAKACFEYTKHEDDRSIRALIDSGFQIFADPYCFGSERGTLKTASGESGMDILHMHWTACKTPPQHLADLFSFIYESQYESACQMFESDESRNFSDFSIHEEGLAELKAYNFDKSKYPDFVIDIENDEAAAKEKFQNSPPHIKFRLAI